MVPRGASEYAGAVRQFLFQQLAARDENLDGLSHLISRFSVALHREPPRNSIQRVPCLWMFCVQ